MEKIQFSENQYFDLEHIPFLNDTDKADFLAWLDRSPFGADAVGKTADAGRLYAQYTAQTLCRQADIPFDEARAFDFPHRDMTEESGAELDNTVWDLAMRSIEEKFGNLDIIAELKGYTDQDHPLAMHAYADYLDHTNADKSRAAEAAALMARAAAHGCPSTMPIVAMRYAEGNGFPKDESAARSWMRAAEIENHSANFTLFGILYCDGTFVEKNLEKSRMFFDAAIKNKDSEAYFELAMRLKHHDLPLDESKPLEWILLLKHGAEIGDSDCMVELANGLIEAARDKSLTFDSDIMQEAMKEAMVWLEKAEKAGNKTAKILMEQIKTTPNGDGTAMNIPQASEQNT